MLGYSQVISYLLLTIAKRKHVRGAYLEVLRIRGVQQDLVNRIMLYMSHMKHNPVNNEILLNTTNTQYLQVSPRTCFLFAIVNRK